MKKVIISLLLVLVLSTFGRAQSVQPEYVGFVLPEAESGENRYQLEPYYFLHYFYTDVLFFFDLLEPLDLQVKTAMVEKMFNNLNEDYPVGIVVKFAGWEEPLRLSYRVFSMEDGRQVLIMLTNYDLEKKELLAEYSDHCYACFYYLFGDKLVDDYHLFSAEKEAEYQSNLNNLADMYIFDEQMENDQLVKDLLTEHLNSASAPVSKFIGHLTFAQYYMVRGELEKADAALATAGMLFAHDLAEADKENLGLTFAMIKEEAEIMPRFKSTLPAEE